MEANGRLQGSKNKGLWPECVVERAMEANGRLQASKNKGLWPECVVEAAAEDFKCLTAGGKRQA